MQRWLAASQCCCHTAVHERSINQPSMAASSPPLQVDLLSATTAPANKAIAIFWGVGGFAAALALHVLQPG